MELICPQCASALQVQGGVATCLKHGGEYDVLFDRQAESVAPGIEPARRDDTCEAHPHQAAVADCLSCGKRLCVLCSFELNGRFFCADCAVSGARSTPKAPVVSSVTPTKEVSTGTAAPAEKECPECGTIASISADKCPACHMPFTLMRLTAPASRRRLAEGLMCTQHSASEAVAACRSCGSGMCATCDFLLPNGLHFCPACVDKAGDEEVAPRRRTLGIAAIVCAAWCTLLYPLTISGALYGALGRPSDVQSFGCAILLLLLAPSIIGTAMAVTAFDKRFRNTPMIRIARVWNVLILTVLIVQYLVWTFR